MVEDFPQRNGYQATPRKIDTKSEIVVSTMQPEFLKSELREPYQSARPKIAKDQYSQLIEANKKSLLSEENHALEEEKEPSDGLANLLMDDPQF